MCCLASGKQRPSKIAIFPVQAIRELPKPLRLLGILNPLGVAELLGRAFMGRCRAIAAILAVLWGTAILIIRPSTWTPPVRSVLSRQLLFTAVDGILSGVRFGAAKTKGKERANKNGISSFDKDDNSFSSVSTFKERK